MWELKFTLWSFWLPHFSRHAFFVALSSIVSLSAWSVSTLISITLLLLLNLSFFSQIPAFVVSLIILHFLLLSSLTCSYPLVTLVTFPRTVYVGLASWMPSMSKPLKYVKSLLWRHRKKMTDWLVRLSLCSMFLQYLTFWQRGLHLLPGNRATFSLFA